MISDPRLKCTLCNFQPRPEKHLIMKHIRSFHTGEKPFACDLCNEKFFASADHRKHYKNKHGRDLPKKCNRQFDTKRTAHGRTIPHNLRSSASRSRSNKRKWSGSSNE